MSNGNNFPNIFGKSSNTTGTTNTSGQTQNPVFGSGLGGGSNLMGNQNGFGVNQGANPNGQNPSGGIPTTNPFSGGFGTQNKTGSNPPEQSSLFNSSTSGVNFNLNTNKPSGTEKVENPQNELNKGHSFGPFNPMNSVNPPIKESSQESSESKPATFNSLTGQTGQGNSLFNLSNNTNSGLFLSNPNNKPENKPDLFSSLTSKPEKIIVPTGNGNTVNTDSAKPQSMQWGSAFNTDKSKSQSVFPGLGQNVGGSTTGNFLIPNKEGQGDKIINPTIPTTNSTLFGNSSNTSQIPTRSPFTGTVTNSTNCTNPISANPEEKKEVVLEQNKTQLGGGLFKSGLFETNTANTANTTNTTNTASNQVYTSNVVNNNPTSTSSLVNNNPTNTSNVVNNNPTNTSNSSLNLNSTGTTNQPGINISKPATNTTSNIPTLTTTTTTNTSSNNPISTTTNTTSTTSNNLLTNPVRAPTTNVVPNPEKKPEGPNIKTSEMFSRKEDANFIQRLMDAEVNGLMKKSIEDVINKWKSDLDQQVLSFNRCGDALMQSEEAFLRQFDLICTLHELINNLREEASREMKRLEELEAEQDNILEKMDIMEDRLDSYLQMLDKSGGAGAVPGDTHDVHQSVKEIAKIVGEVQKDIDESNKKISNPELDGSGQGQNEFTTILNSHYNALRSVQFMEQHLLTQMAAFEEELNRRNLEKSR